MAKRRILYVAVSCAITLFVPVGPLEAQLPEPEFDFTLGMQGLYSHDFPDVGDSGGSFSARRFRPGVTGSVGPFTFLVMPELAGGSATLLDAFISHEFHPLARLTVGQGKVPFTRQFLTSYLHLQFVGTSLATSRFDEGRQPGAWVSGEIGDGALQFTAGLFNGEGLNTADQNNDLMEVARVVWTPLGPYALMEGSVDRPEDPRLHIGGAVLNKKEGPEGEGDDDADDVLRLGIEMAFKLKGFNAVGELFHERREADGRVEVDTIGWYGQAGYLLESGYELALRYSGVNPDTFALPSGELDFGESELGMGLNRYIEGHNMKVQAEFLHFEHEVNDASHDAVRVQLQVAF